MHTALKVPTANDSPFGLQAIDVITVSIGLLTYKRFPKASEMRYVQSSPPLTMRPLATFQLTHNTILSWATHDTDFLLVCTVLMTKEFPLVKRIWSSSGPQQAAYTD